MLGRQADDRPKDFYQPHSDDMQGIEVVSLPDGRVFWFMPYQGMHFIYEVSGWKDLKRQRGTVDRPKQVTPAQRKGTGLTAEYRKDGRKVLQRVETPIYCERFGAERKAPAPPYQVTWSGAMPTTRLIMRGPSSRSIRAML